MNIVEYNARALSIMRKMTKKQYNWQLSPFHDMILMRDSVMKQASQRLTQPPNSWLPTHPWSPSRTKNGWHVGDCLSSGRLLSNGGLLSVNYSPFLLCNSKDPTTAIASLSNTFPRSLLVQEGFPIQVKRRREKCLGCLEAKAPAQIRARSC